MPGAAFHSHYWQQDHQEAPVIAGGGGGGGYTPWQMNIIGFGLGALQSLWDRFVTWRRSSP